MSPRKIENLISERLVIAVDTYSGPKSRGGANGGLKRNVRGYGVIHLQP